MKNIIAFLGMLLFVSGCVSAKTIEQNLAQDYQDNNNETCLVMKGKEVSGKHYWVHDGKRYALCCDSCVWLFKRNPEQYISENL